MLYGYWKLHSPCKSEDVYQDLVEDIDTSNYKVKRFLLTDKNKKVIRLMKDKLGWKIMKRIVSLRPKMYSYLTDDGYIDKKVKGTKEYGIKRHIKSRD